jgi:methylase of polypeptide subunit release factors
MRAGRLAASVGVPHASRIAREQRFFHWELEFPSVFTSSDDETGTPDRAGGFDVIVGNPPFLNQLASTTAADRGAAAMLRTLTGGAVRGLADMAAAFLVRSCSWCRDGGRVSLVQPRSVLSATDVRPVRAAVARSHALVSLWVSNEHAFTDAGVYVCAPTIAVGERRRVALHVSVGRGFSRLEPITIDNDELAEAETWAHLAPACGDPPALRVNKERTLADLADSTADFRDQYYGLRGFIVDDHDVDMRDANVDRERMYPPILTSGLIDLAACRWGATPARLLKAVWSAPRVDRRRLERESDLGQWIAARVVPKVMVATQTRVIEAFVDEAGRFVPSVPVITVQPKAASDLWRVAAVVASPVCGAIAMRTYAGAAMSADAIKLSAKQVLRLPLPRCAEAWDDAAELLRSAQQSDDDAERDAALLAFGDRMCDSYALGQAEHARVMTWWSERLTRRRRPRGERTQRVHDMGTSGGDTPGASPG